MSDFAPERTASSSKEKQNFEEYKKDEGDSLFSVAFEQVGKGASKESLFACMSNIQSANDYKFDELEIVKIPKPCDPAEKQQGKPSDKFDVNAAAKELAAEFRKSAPYDAAEKLSEQLQGLTDTLGTNERKYNYLISKLNEQLPNGSSNSYVEAFAWNKTTTTWDKVHVIDNHYPQTPPVPIIQPGNTLESLTADRINYLRRNGFVVDKDDYIEETMRINKIEDARKLPVAKPLELPREDRFRRK